MFKKYLTFIIILIVSIVSLISGVILFNLVPNAQFFTPKEALVLTTGCLLFFFGMAGIIVDIALLCGKYDD